MLRLAFAVFAVQAGFHAFTATLPVALAQAGVPDPQIGLIVGTAALVQIPAAFLTGIVVDRVGGVRAFTAGGLAYIVRLRDPGAPRGRAGRFSRALPRRKGLPGDRHRRDPAGRAVARAPAGRRDPARASGSPSSIPPTI